MNFKYIYNYLFIYIFINIFFTACSVRKNDQPDVNEINTNDVIDAGLKKIEPLPPPQDPVLWYDKGKQAGVIEKSDAIKKGLTILNLSDDWTPFIFSEEDGMPNDYRKVFLDLANERGEPVHQAEPMFTQYYLEVYGIPPSLSILQKRFLKEEENNTCFEEVNYDEIKKFTGYKAYVDGKIAAEVADGFWRLEKRVKQLQDEFKVDSPEKIKEIDLKGVKNRDRIIRDVDKYLKNRDFYYAVREAQKRLACSKLFPGKGRYTVGALDWPTHIALVNFERRNLIYAWGFFGKDTTKGLGMTMHEEYYNSLKRVIEARVVDAAGIIEDGTSFINGNPPHYKGMDGKTHKLRNLTEEFTDVAMKELGLDSVEKGIEFLKNTKNFDKLYIAVKLPDYPEYYSDDMDFLAYIDRGDVWYDFPYDEFGNEISQPITRKPTIYLYINYLGQKIPLIRWGTTIGGWRSEYINGEEFWRYKESDVGARVWRDIVAAPVWIPPDTTPPRDLLRKIFKGRKLVTEIDYPDMGPGYASAYGLVAGIHEKMFKRNDNTYSFYDNGIRTHGSVDYMSINRRHSHGCHRLHNHLAVRLFTYVIKHRPFKRIGQVPVNYLRKIEYEDEEYTIELKTRGYYYEMDPPINVYVDEGRIKGTRKTAIREPVPKYEPDAGVPDGGTDDGGTKEPLKFISPF